MRLIGLILALAAIGWTLYSASGGGNAKSAIPEGYQQSLQKAEGVEQTLQTLFSSLSVSPNLLVIPAQAGISRTSADYRT